MTCEEKLKELEEKLDEHLRWSRQALRKRNERNIGNDRKLEERLDKLHDSLVFSEETFTSAIANIVDRLDKLDESLWKHKHQLGPKPEDTTSIPFVVAEEAKA